MRRLLLIVALGALFACGAPSAAGEDDPLPNPKWFVCKYETTPGEGERLQTGQNPISVSENAFPAGVTPAVGVEFNDAQGRSLIIAADVGQPEPSPSDCPPPNPPPTTTTTAKPTTTTSSTTSSTTSTTSSTTSTTSSIPTGGPFTIQVGTVCPDGVNALINITFGNRTDLAGQVGTLTFSPVGSPVQLTYIPNATVQVPYPATTAAVTLTYTLGAESVTETVTFPANCVPPTTTTTATTTTAPGATTTTVLGATTTTTLPPTFSFGAAASVCVAEVPTIVINFLNQFPQLAGVTGTLTMATLTGTVVSTQPLVYQPNTTVSLLYPGTRVNADGSIADVPGWNLNSAGFWVRDPSDAFLRDGIRLTYTVNPTATATVTYPPESSTCANPDGPFPPGVTPPPTVTSPPTAPGLPPTR